MRKEPMYWSRVENAAKIFPSLTNRADTKVFRFSCELMEEVDQAVLQTALERTLEAFPFYLSSLRQGFFWYFFEASSKKPIVHPEVQPPCSELYHPDHHGLLFSVTWYRARINLEVYHSLTDGTGALEFLRILVFHYLEEKYPEVKKLKMQMPYDAPLGERLSDSFARNYTGKDRNMLPKKGLSAAYHIKGKKLPLHQLHIIEGTMSATQVLEKAHEYHTTISVFLCSILLLSIHDLMPKRLEKQPIRLSIPVNLRNYYPSESARNFFSVVTIGYDFSKQSHGFSAVLEAVRKGFEEELREEHIESKFNQQCALEHNPLMRVLPLMVKNISIKVANRCTERAVTAAFSNVGRLRMPQELVPYIRQFHIFTSTKRLQVCLCTFEDKLSINFSAPFLEKGIQRQFFRRLTNLGIAVEITANNRKEYGHADL